MKLKDKLEKGYTGTLVFLTKYGEYFSSMEINSLKTEVKIYEILRTIIQKKTGNLDLYLNKSEKEILKLLKGFKILTGNEYELLLKKKSKNK